MPLKRDALLAFGATLAGVGIALCIGEGRGHPLGELWFLVGIACLIVGFGVLIATALDRSPASVPHDQRLRMMLGGARSSIKSESGCSFADPARDAAEGGSEELRLHFRRLTKVKDSYRELLAFDREQPLREIGELEATPQFRRRRGCRTCRVGAR